MGGGEAGHGLYYNVDGKQIPWLERFQTFTLLEGGRGGWGNRRVRSVHIVKL